MNVMLMGKHRNRSPLHYDAFKTHIEFNNINILHNNSSVFPDAVVLAYHHDLNECASEIRYLQKKNPSLKVIVISEEPLWDVTWHGSPTSIQNLHSKTGLEYYYFNHFNCDIYKDLHLPYFILTESKYLARYIYFLQKHIKLSSSDLIAHWNNQRYKFAAIVEKRDDIRYNVKSLDGSVLGLSYLRTKLCEKLIENKNVLLKGKGWNDDIPRQSLPDWHADKLTTVNKDALFTLAMENVVCKSYVTEKVFDAFCSLSIPVVADVQRDVLSEFFNTDLFYFIEIQSIHATLNFDTSFINSEYAGFYSEQLVSIKNKLINTESLHDSRGKIINKISSLISSTLCN